MTDADTLFFMNGHAAALPLYERFEEKLLCRFPEASKRVQKTQITFFKRHVFACVSFARVKRKAKLPEPYLVLTIGLPYSLDSPRVAVKTEAYPGRWTHHIALGQEADLNDELFDWVGEAYAFAERK